MIVDLMAWTTIWVSFFVGDKKTRGFSTAKSIFGISILCCHELKCSIIILLETSIKMLILTLNIL